MGGKVLDPVQLALCVAATVSALCDAVALAVKLCDRRGAKKNASPHEEPRGEA